MLSIGCNYNKLKTNLRLAICRLKLLEKKKIEIAQKLRKEISEYLANDKIERAKIRVEHVIREDFHIEAMQIVEMYCDLLLSRFGLIQQKTHYVDDALDDAISSLIWAAPRLQTDVPELKAIENQLAVKYGKRYALTVRKNGSHSVNEKLVHNLSAKVLPKILVEKYLMEIARSYNVSYEPDEEILAEKEQDKAICNIALIDLDDTKPPCPGFIPNSHPSTIAVHPDIQYPSANLSKPFNYPAPNISTKSGEVPPPIPPSTPYPEPGTNSDATDFNAAISAASYESAFGVNPSVSNIFVNTTPGVSNAASVIPISTPPTKFLIDILPELPSVPNTILPDFGGNSTGNNEVDFDNLVQRFEKLKK